MRVIGCMVVLFVGCGDSGPGTADGGGDDAGGRDAQGRDAAGEDGGADGGGGDAGSCADEVPVERRPAGGSWTGIVGVPGGIPHRETIAATLSPGASADDVSDALDAAAEGEVVLLRAGTYDITGSIHHGASGVTLRGETGADGRPATILRFSGGSTLGSRIIFRHQADSSWDVSNRGQFTNHSVVSGATRGSTTVTLDSAPASLTPGRMMFLSAPDDGDMVRGGGWALWFGDRPWTQVVEVTAVSGNDVSFTPAINADYLGADLEASYRSEDHQLDRAGIEDLSIDYGGAGGHGIRIEGANECWLRNLELENAAGDGSHHVYIYAVRNLEVRHCDVHTQSTLSSNAYGMLSVHSSGLLVVDNVFHDLPNVWPMFGLSGSVFAYNYTVDHPYDPPSWLSQIVFFHGCASHFNLFEGNWVASHYHDSTDGSTYSRNNLFYRERMLGWDEGKTGNTHAIAFDGDHDDVTIAASVMGRDGYHDQYEGTSSTSIVTLGQEETWTGEGFLRIGNYNHADHAVPAAEAPGGGCFPASYLYPDRPPWFGDRPWPPVDPGTPAIEPDVLPAGYRFVHGTDPPGARR